MQQPIIIIGAGLAGLSAAYFLQKKGLSCLVLEARDRPGGRISTSRTDGGTPLELGATWFGTKHAALVNLLGELGLQAFEQVTGGRAIYEAISTSPAQVVQLPHNDQPSYRISGGSDALIKALVAALPKGTIRFGTAVKSITIFDSAVALATSNGPFSSKRVVSTLPPNLLVSTVEIIPDLPADVVRLARQTHTWMGESIKVGLRYAHPFWREEGRPGGTIFSNVGPVSEMYDHSNVENTGYALKGFLNGTYFSLSREERRDIVLDQLRKYYGDVVDDFTAYEEAVWRNEPCTFVPNDGHVLPHQHNGHQCFREAHFGGRLIMAGSETSAAHPGYMDGAVQSGKRVVGLLVSTGCS